MADRPLPRMDGVRGWDIFVGFFLAFIGLVAAAWNDRPLLHWLVPLAVLGAWYVLLGRRAIRTRERGWVLGYLAGAVPALAVGMALDPWLAPLQGTLIPLVWWLFLSDRRWAVVWTVVVAASSGLALAVFAVVHRGDPVPWSPIMTVVYLGITPPLVATAGIVAGRWADTLFRWGQERMALVDDLRQTEARRIALEREAAANEERLRLSQEIHDTIAQDAAGLRLLVERARRQAGAQPPSPLDRTLDMIAGAVDSLHSESRDLIVATAPVPAGSSFAEAVERITGRFARETDITVETAVAGVRLTRETEVVFIRCLQEGLSNVRKHARATHVWLSVTASEEAAMMTLADDGVGLPAEVPLGFGLPGMGERVRQAGGSFAVSSPGPHGGVGLCVRMPRQAPAPDVPA